MNEEDNAQNVLNHATKIAERLENEGPLQLGSFKRTLLRKTYQQHPRGRRTKQRVLNRAHKHATKAERRALSEAQERKAHRRFDVAIGRRPNTAPLVSEGAKDVAAMFSSDPNVAFKKGGA